MLDFIRSKSLLKTRSRSRISLSPSMLFCTFLSSPCTKSFIIQLKMFTVVFSVECESCDSLLVQRNQCIVQHQCV
ncbi:hypothetical protein PO909_028035 [Leuciscus waleckii]